jgi:predicted secreted protein
VFCHWWIALFALIPVSLYTNHGIIVNSQIEDADFEEVKEDGA